MTLRSMNAVYLRKAIAGASIIFGIWMLWEVVVPPIFRLVAEGMTPPDYVSYLLLIPIVVLMAIPGCLSSYFGLKLFQEVTETSLRWVLGTFTGVAAFWMACKSSAMFPTLLPERLLDSVGFSVAILVALPAYLFSLRVLLRELGGPRRRALDFVGRGVLLVVAWNIFSLLRQLFDAYTPLKPGHKYLYREPWGFVGFIVPIGVAYGFFKASQYFLARRSKRQEAQLSEFTA